MYTIPDYNPKWKEIGIFPLAVDLQRDPDMPLVKYYRVSSPTSAGPAPDRPLLKAKMRTLDECIKRMAPRVKIVGPPGGFEEIQEGQIAIPRPELEKAGVCALAYNARIVTIDLSKYIRAISYSRLNNRNAWPTRREFDRLHERTLHRPLMTIEDPLLEEDGPGQRHGKATRRTGKAGRKRTVTDSNEQLIMAALGLVSVKAGRLRFETPIEKVVKQLGVTKQAILRAIDECGPEEYQGYCTWREDILARSAQAGLIEISEDGVPGGDCRDNNRPKVPLPRGVQWDRLEWRYGCWEDD